MFLLIVKYLFKSFFRPFIWLVGVTWIKRTKLRINDVIASYKPVKDASKTAPLVVSNHTGWFDMFFYLMHNISFLAKKEIANAPIVGTIATLRQCLYLDRECPENRNITMKMINDRIQKVNDGEPIPPLLIFPEGTVTNGRSLMSFKKGAFVSGDLIKIYALKYNTEPLSYVWSISNINTFFSVLISLSQLINTIELIEYEDNFDPHWVYQTKKISPTDEESWKEVAAVVKSLMAFAGNFQTDETTTRDLNQLSKESAQYNKTLIEEEAKLR